MSVALTTNTVIRYTVVTELSVVIALMVLVSVATAPQSIAVAVSKLTMASMMASLNSSLISALFT